MRHNIGNSHEGASMARKLSKIKIRLLSQARDGQVKEAKAALNNESYSALEALGEDGLIALRVTGHLVIYTLTDAGRVALVSNAQS